MMIHVWAAFQCKTCAQAKEPSVVLQLFTSAQLCLQSPSLSLNHSKSQEALAAVRAALQNAARGSHQPASSSQHPESQGAQEGQSGEPARALDSNVPPFLQLLVGQTAMSSNAVQRLP